MLKADRYGDTEKIPLFISLCADHEGMIETLIPHQRLLTYGWITVLIKNCWIEKYELLKRLFGRRTALMRVLRRTNI